MTQETIGFTYRPYYSKWRVYKHEQGKAVQRFSRGDHTRTEPTITYIATADSLEEAQQIVEQYYQGQPT